jgi:hypothetical protein
MPNCKILLKSVVNMTPGPQKNFKNFFLMKFQNSKFDFVVKKLTIAIACSCYILYCF